MIESAFVVSPSITGNDWQSRVQIANSPLPPKLPPTMPPSSCLPQSTSSSSTFETAGPKSGRRYLNMNDPNAAGRRRRSSSILQVYHEPPETLEQISDQAALPNLNANWTNAKGMVGLGAAYFPACCCLIQLLTLCRSMDYPHCLDSGPQDLLRCHSGSLSGDLLDADQHDIYVRVLPDVPLRSRRAFRVQ